MKHQQSRFLALLLALSMVLAMFPTTLIAASAEETVSTTTWTKTTLEEIKSTDTVAITMTKDDTTYLLPTAIGSTASDANPAATVVTVDGDTLTTDDSAGWTIVAVDGGYAIKSGEKYLGIIDNGNNNVRLIEDEAVWTVNGEGYLQTDPVNAKDITDGKTRWLGVYIKNPDWRAYGTTGSIPGNLAGEELNFWVLGAGGSTTPVEPTDPTEPTDPVEPTEPTSSEAPIQPNEPIEPTTPGEGLLLTELNDGDRVYVYAPSNGLAMTATCEETETSSMFLGVEAEVIEDVLTVTDDMLALNVHLIGTTEPNADGDVYNTYTFTTDDGLYLTSTGKNVLTLEATESEEAVWSVSNLYDEDGNFQANLVKNVAESNSNVYLETYNGYFTTYSRYYYNSAFNIQFFSAEAATGGFVTELTAGDKVVIYNPASGMVVNSTVADTENNKFLNGTQVVLTADDTLDGYTDADVWTVGTIENDKGTFYTFVSKDGKYMFGNFTGLYLNDEVTEGWTLKTADDYADCFFLAYNYPILSWSADNNNFGMAFQYTESGALRFYSVGSSGSGSTIKTVSAPSASPRSGEVFSGDTVEFSCKTEGATILYRVNDSEEWITYTEPVVITEDVTFTVKAVADGMNDSREVTYTYTVYVPPVLGEHRAELVTDASTLSSGDLILIVTQKQSVALGQNQKPNNRDYADVIKDDSIGMLSYDPEVTQIVQLQSGIKEGTFALYCYNGENTGYLYAALGTGSQGSNWLRTQDSKDNEASWTISINDDNSAVITSLADKTSNTIRYNTSGIFSCYGAKGQQPVCIYKLCEGNEKPGLPEEGSEVVIYNLTAQGVLSGMTGDLSDLYGCYINTTKASIVDGKALCENGAVVFTVSKSGEFYRFYNESFGYLCSYGGGNNAYYTKELTDDANWILEEYNGSYKMKSNAYFDDAGTIKPQYLQFFSDHYVTWGMFAVTDRDVFTYYFYPCANDKLTDGVVNEPRALVGKLADAVVGQRYLLHFTIDALFGLKDLKVTLNGTELECTELSGNYTAVIPVELISGESLEVVISGHDNKDVAFSTVVTIPVKDEPGITNVRPVANSETGEEKRPEISAILTNVGENPTIELKVNDEIVEFTYADGKVSYTPATDFADGRVTVSLTVTRADGKSVSKNWNFVVGESSYQLLFGQLHSHTGEYSDGAGTLAGALEYIAAIPESDNVDFVAFTDHSNYFDNDVDGGNPEQALYDLSLATPQAQKMWSTYKTTIAEFNETHDDVIAIAGFEMTWSGGPGHMNTFCTDGIVSRQNHTLNSKTGDAGMRAYYALLAQDEGIDSITQFNHPGTMFGNFTDFSYWSEEADSRVYLVEVGNGTGQVGGSGYYPSYEQYTLALDKGWHIGPTNNQDNHGVGMWGNANTCRDVVLAEDFSEEAIYEAIRALRIYATEDKNLEITYTVNGLPMGTIIEEVPGKLSFEITVMDPDETDSISKVELISNSGKVSYTWDNADELATGILTAELSPDYTYYYVRVTQADNDLAVTAPIWVGESLKLSLDEVTASTTTPVAGESVTISTTLTNSEDYDAQVKSIVYTTDDSKVLASDSTVRVLAAGTSLTIDWNYIPEKAKLTTISVTVIVEMDGKDYTYTASIDLDVQDPDSIAYIGVDAAHENEYVAGYNKELIGNFTSLAEASGIRVETLATGEALINACTSGKYTAIVLNAPSRRSGKSGLTYSAEELAALTAFNANGGTLIVTGLGDSNDQLADATHTAATQNALLEALGSTLRLSDDGLYDGTSFSVTLNAFGTSDLVDGLTEGISYYGGSTIYAVDAEGNATTTLPTTVETMLFANAGNTSVDKDGDGLGGDATPKYTYAEGDDRLLVMAAERAEGKGMIIVAGSPFMNDFDLAIPATTGNNALCENLFSALNPIKITPIAEVRKQTESGYRYTIEGIVTTNASGYDKDTAFFDCLYVQDETGGICCFPIATDFKIGDVLRVTATTHWYQGEAELQVIEAVKVGEATPVEPIEISIENLNNRSEEGKLVTIKGIVAEVAYANGDPESIYVKAPTGEVARIHIDGYINNGVAIEGLEVGALIEATGLASFDDAYDNKNESDARLRIRNRAEIICTALDNPFSDVTVADWYYLYVMAAADAELINGYTDGTYRPEGSLTRAEATTLLYRLSGSPEVTGTASFTDLPNEWYRDAIAWAEQTGIVNGFSDGTFRPDEAVTREQFVTMVWRLNGEPEATADLEGFVDADAVQPYARTAFAWAVQNGILNGITSYQWEGVRLAPQDNIKRSETAKILCVYSDLI